MRLRKPLRGCNLGTGSPPPHDFLNLATLLGIPKAALDEMFWQKLWALRVMIPAIVVSFDSVHQTVTVQPAIQENMLQNGVVTPTNLPQLVNVPVCLPRAGGLAITLPLAAGDEGIVIFADMCIDAWWQSGGTANNQVERRRHDLSDGMFYPGGWSQPRVLPNYSTTMAQLRTDDGTVYVGVNETGIYFNGPIQGAVTFAGTVEFQADVTVDTDLTVDGTTKLGGKTFATHSHSGVTTGSSDTGPPV